MGGIVLALLGTVVGVGFLVRLTIELLDPAAPKHGWVAAIPGILCGAFFAYIGYWLLLWKDEIDFDATARTYRRRRGWAAGARAIEGSCSDLEDIRLERIQNKTGRFWCGRLKWKASGTRCPDLELFRFGDPNQAIAEARRLGTAMGIRVDESAIEDQRRKEALEDAWRARWGRRLRPYWTAIITAAVLLVINSLVPGVHLYNRWVDEDGRVFERWSTLFHTFTRVQLAGKPLGDLDEKWYVIFQSSHSSGYFAKRDNPKRAISDQHWSIRVGRFPVPRPAAPPPASKKGTR